MGLGQDSQAGKKKESTYHIGLGREEPPKGLMDTASSCLLIRQELVKPHWILPRGRIKTEYQVHGDNKFCPMAEVTLKIKGKFRQKHVGVVDGLPHCLLLGMDWNPFLTGTPRQVWRPRRAEIKPEGPDKEEIYVKGLEEPRHESIDKREEKENKGQA